jgi:acyl-CoA synthetase (NDP forming)
MAGSGAMCGVIGDAAELSGLELPEFAPETVRALRDGGLPDFATPQNPLDTSGYVVINPKIMPMSQEAVTRDPHVDLVVFHGSVPSARVPSATWESAMADTERTIEQSPVPVIPMDFLPGDHTGASRALRRRI